MATFSKPTQDAIDRAKERTEVGATNADAVGWAQDVGDALDGMRRETGDAALLNATTDGDGKLVSADDDGKILPENLPEIPTDRLPTGDSPGDIPVVGDDGVLPTALLDAAPTGTAGRLRTLPSGDKLMILTDTGTHRITLTDVAPLDDIVGVYMVAVGGGARGDPITPQGARQNISRYPYPGETISSFIPMFALRTYLREIDGNANSISVTVGSFGGHDSTEGGLLTDVSFAFIEGQAGIVIAGRGGIDDVSLAKGGVASVLPEIPSGTQWDAAEIYEKDALHGVESPATTLTLTLENAQETPVNIENEYGGIFTPGAVILYFVVDEG